MSKSKTKTPKKKATNSSELPSTSPQSVADITAPKKFPDLPIAIISDVHANLPALEAVLADIASLGIEVIVCLGDTVGYGNDAARCIQLVRERCVFSVRGNHELMLTGYSKALLKQMPVTIGGPILKARQELENEIEWAKKLPMSVVMSPLVFSHASLHEPKEFHYVFDPGDAQAHFAATPEQTSFFGHTHQPAIWQERNGNGSTPLSYQPVYDAVILDKGKRHAINVGSVGQSRDGDERPAYAIFNPGNLMLVFRRVQMSNS